MRITFVKECQSVLTGNERYPAGSRAYLERGQQLIDQGVARAGWGQVEEPAKPSIADLRSMKVADLREMAEGLGVSATGKRRADLIEAIQEVG